MTSQILMSELKREVDELSNKVQSVATSIQVLNPELVNGTYPIPAGARFAVVRLAISTGNWNPPTALFQIDGFTMLSLYGDGPDNNFSAQHGGAVPIWVGAQNARVHYGAITAWIY